MKPKPTSKSFYVANSSFRYISEYYGDEDIPIDEAEEEFEEVDGNEVNLASLH
jgi:hypothetical protein